MVGIIGTKSARDIGNTLGSQKSQQKKDAPVLNRLEVSSQPLAQPKPELLKLYFAGNAMSSKLNPEQNMEKAFEMKNMKPEEKYHVFQEVYSGAGINTKQFLAGQIENLPEDKRSQAFDKMLKECTRGTITKEKQLIRLALAPQLKNLPEASRERVYRELSTNGNLGVKLELTKQIKHLPEDTRMLALKEMNHKITNKLAFLVGNSYEPTPVGLPKLKDPKLKPSVEKIKAVSEQFELAMLKQVSSLKPEDQTEGFDMLKDIRKLNQGLQMLLPG